MPMTLAQPTTLDEILTEYEALWRQAALNGTPQGRGDLCGGASNRRFARWRPDETCAWLIVSRYERSTVQHLAGVHNMTWHCPEDKFHACSLSHVLMHLNNAHDWTWDRLANKTRDALREGGVPC